MEEAGRLPNPMLGRLRASDAVRFRTAVAALTVLALVLAFVHLASKSIWGDESKSIDHARGGLTSLARVMGGRDPNMGLYYFVLHFWTRTFGESELAVRSLSALFGAAAIPMLYLVGARLFGRTAGMIAALLLAVNGFFVQYEQTARSYSLVVLLVAVSSYFFLEELEQPSRRTRAGFVLASALGVYAHYFAVYVLAAQLLVVVVSRRRQALVRWPATTAAIALLCVPEAVAATRKGTGGIAWIQKPTIHGLGQGVLAVTGGSRTLLVLFFIAGCAGAALAVHRGELWQYGLAAAWFLVPVLGSFVVSFVQPIFVPYYLIVSLPGLLLVSAFVIACLPRPAAVAAVLVFVSLSSLRVADWYGQPSHENWRGAVRFVLAATHRGDGVLFYPRYLNTPFEYYERRQAGARLESLDPSASAVALSKRPRIWLAFQPPDARPYPSDFVQLLARVRRTHRPVLRRAFVGVTVELDGAR